MALFDEIRMGSSAAGGDFEIERSLRFNAADSPGLSRTPSSTGNTRTFTVSAWVKRTSFGSGHTIFSAGSNSSNLFAVYFPSEQFSVTEIDGGSQHLEKNSTALFRDPTAWYHIVAAIDTTQSTAEDRVIAYINGVRITDYAANTIFSQNTDTIVNSTNSHYVGRMSTGNYFDGYIAEFNFIDGQQLTPSSFAETDSLTGQYNPIKYTGSYGTNGFYLNFSDNSGTSATTLGKDSSGNGHNFTPNNFSVSAGTGNDSSIDTPTNNFPTWNPLNSSKQNGGATAYSEGNLKLNTTAVSGQGTQYPFGFISFGATSGKWYAEFKGDTSNHAVGIANLGQIDSDVTSNPYGAFANTSFIYTNSGEIRTNNNNLSNQATYGSGDIIGVAMDLDNMKLYFHKNGTYINSGNPSTGSNGYDIGALPSNKSGEYTFSCGSNGVSSVGVFANLGQIKTASTSYADSGGIGSFDYEVPTGFKTLCTANLPDPTIIQGNKYFDIATWAGNDGAQTISSLEFQPDLVWIKATDRAENHFWTDSVRGAGKSLASNVSSAETDNSSKFTGFTSSGFTMNSTDNEINGGGVNYVAWNWAAGTAFSNSVGSNSATISSSGSVNTTAGFSIVSYVGNATRDQLVYHGLNAAPKWFLVKRRDGDNWIMYHGQTQETNPQQYYYEFQNQDAVKGSNTAFMWDDIVPNSNNFGIYSDGAVNNNGSNIIAWVWSEVEGFSKFGHLIGNGNSDGTYVHCGFTPRFIIVKNNNQGFNTVIQDTHRSPGNVAAKKLCPDSTAAEASANDSFDILSHGFKMRTSDAGTNANGSRYVFMAFATNPLKYARAR